MMAKLSLTGIAAFALCLAAGAAAAQDQDWPCEQVLQPQLSVGSMWAGPDPTAARASWENDEAVKTLVVRVAPRRVPLDEAKEEIRRFALGITGDRQKLLTEVFAGLFETINHGAQLDHPRHQALSRPAGGPGQGDRGQDQRARRHRSGLGGSGGGSRSASTCRTSSIGTRGSSTTGSGCCPPSAGSPCCWSSASTSSPTPSWTTWASNRR